MPNPSARASRPERSGRLAIAGVAVSIVSLAAVAWWALHQSAPRLPDASGEIIALGSAVIMYAVTTALRAERWKQILSHDGTEAARADCYALTTIGFMGNNVLPARGGDVLRVYLLKRTVPVGARRIIGTLVAERVLDVVVLLATFVVVAYALLGGAGIAGTGRLLGAVGLLLAGGGIVWLLWTRAEGEGRLSRLAAFVRPMLVSTLRLRGRHGVAVLALTLAIWLTEAGTWYLCAVASDLGVSPLETLYLIALASIFVLIPAGPGYAGTLDAAVVVGAEAVGAGGAEAVTYLILLRFVLLVPITIVGLIVLVTRYGGLSQLRSARAEGGVA